MPITESKLKSGTLTIEGNSFATQATNVTLTPDVDEQGDALEVLSGDTLSPDERTMWALGIEAVQDFTNPAGFVEYCRQNAGDVVAFSWKPAPAAATYSGTVKVRAVEIGGDVNARLTTSAEFPVIGGLTVTPAAP